MDVYKKTFERAAQAMFTIEAMLEHYVKNVAPLLKQNPEDVKFEIMAHANLLSQKAKLEIKEE